jgi:NAD(P)-dependent dehydrogenase (short-subunit alcohol dehydrogenase family)
MTSPARLRTLMDLEGRVAVITGGAGQLGQVMTEALAELGATVVVLDREQTACECVAAGIQERFAVRALPLECDLSRQLEVQAVPPRVIQSCGRLDILVNCAAFVGLSQLSGWAVPFPEQCPDTWRSALEVNLTAPFVLTQACAAALESAGHGSVINIGSIYGLVGPDLSLYEGTDLGNPAAYAASKGGLLQLTRWLATALAPKVRVNSITPGGVWRNQPDAFYRRYLARTPLGRMASPEDLKGAVAYLASDLSAYVTGHNLIVDGGWTAW